MTLWNESVALKICHQVGYKVVYNVLLCVKAKDIKHSIHLGYVSFIVQFKYKIGITVYITQRVALSFIRIAMFVPP